MKHEPIEPAAPHDGAPSTHLVEVLPPEHRHDGWSRARQAQFLRALAATHSVAEAARSVGMSRQSAYKLRARLKGEPFDIAWAAAFRLQYDALVEALVERAINGVEVPHFYKGELIHTSRRYDERAGVALLALRERLPPPRRCFDAEDEGIATDDFETLVARVEYGEAQWQRLVCGDADEAEDEAEDEAGGQHPDAPDATA